MLRDYVAISLKHPGPHRELRVLMVAD
jgi:hypothetical protein